MSNLMNVQNYDSLSMPCLIHLLKNFSNVYFDEKKPIIFSITKKYFEEKSSVNLYDLILYHFKFRVVEERLDYILFVLGRELDGNMSDLPMEYREDFFRVLLGFLTAVEEYAKKQNGTVEWQLSNIPKLLDYLGEIEKSDITSYSLRQKINALVVKIKEDFEKTKTDGIKLENALVPVKNQGLSIEETEEKLSQIKTLKLKKSKLNKGNLCDALSSFELYSDEDKEYLVNYMYRHNWVDCVKSINDIVAFDYFCKHTKYSLLSEKYNPFRILSGAFFELQNRYSESYLKKWLDYFNVSTFDEMMKSIEKWYKSFNGATEQGWVCYEKKLLSVYLTDTRTYFMDSSELARYAKNLLLLDYEKYLTFFIPYKGKTLLDWLEKVETISECVCKDYPNFKDDNEIIEGLIRITNEKYLLSYYCEIYDKYSDKLFHYHGGFTNSSKIEIDPVVKDYELINDFIYILNTIVFDGEMLVCLRNNRKINWEPYGVWNNERNVKKDVMSFIQSYFCQNSENMTDEFIRDLWYNEEHYSAFCYFTDYHNFSGAFKEPNDYSFFFFEKLKDSINFGNIDDLKLFFRLNGNYYTKSKMFISFYEKFKNECIDCYTILNDFIKGNTEGQERDIIQFIKLYYSV